jgi:DNA topoisomerase-3
MPKSLIIAEKPSVAGDLARALGKFTKNSDFYENDDYVISSAIGHLVELTLPSEMDKKRGKWSFENLPVIPDQFELKPIEKTQSRFKLLQRLMKRPDIDEIINACDAGREGELIFNYIYQLAKAKKPVRRLWLQSMTRSAIQEAFGRLRPAEEMRPLADAAVCRSESDWLVGINGTRALTAFNSALNGGFQKTPVGRVQTPTLAIIVEREQKIRSHVVRTYYEVHGTFGVQTGEYPGRWLDPNFRRAKGQDEEFKPERLWEREKAEAIVARCTGQPGVITETKKPTSQSSPLLYDLTTLQREANSRFGFSARRTLQIAQALYERYKVLTYPRTDSRYLPEDNLGPVRRVLGGFGHPELRRLGAKALDVGWVRMDRRVFDNSKVSDHSAIIPTGEEPRNLDEAHYRIYEMVAKRLLAVFYPPARFEVTTRLTVVAEETFKTEGKVLVEAGWLEVYGRQEGEGNKGSENLVPIREGEPARTLSVEVRENQTKPPPRYTEATLLSAMEGAGKLVDDEDLREAMKEKGLGTPATRAAIIEGLIMDDYLVREGKDLIPQPKAFSLVDLLKALKTDVLCSPELTGEWEYKLKRMEAGALDRERFMDDIRAMTRDMVEKARSFRGGEIAGDYVTLGVPCPKCGGQVKEEYGFFRCAAPQCDFQVKKILGARQFSPEEVEELITRRRIGPLDGFVSKMGRPFSAELKLDDEYRVAFDFGEPEGGEDDLAKAEPVAVVGDRWKIFDRAKSWVIEDLKPELAAQAPAAGATPASAAEGKKPAAKAGARGKGKAPPKSRAKAKKTEEEGPLRISKTILQQDIDLEQVSRMLENGQTDLLTKFVSRKGRPFSAHLKLEPGGKVGFVFPERDPNDKGSGGGRRRFARKPAASQG